VDLDFGKNTARSHLEFGPDTPGEITKKTNGKQKTLLHFTTSSPLTINNKR
jgi:hypothetical protein